MCTLCVWLLLFNKTLLDFFIILLCKSAACLCFSTLYGSVTVYSSFHWWTVVLFPCFRYCEQYWYNHLHINLYKDVFFISLRCIDRIYLLNYLLIFKVFFPRNNQTLLQSRGGVLHAHTHTIINGCCTSSIQLTRLSLQNQSFSF